MSSEGTDLDPDIEIWVRRTKSLRRYIAKNPEGRQMVNEIYGIYKNREEPATTHTPADMKGKLMSGQPGSALRGRQRKQCQPKGPVGYLLAYWRRHTYKPLP